MDYSLHTFTFNHQLISFFKYLFKSVQMIDNLSCVKTCTTALQHAAWPLIFYMYLSNYEIVSLRTAYFPIHLNDKINRSFNFTMGLFSKHLKLHSL